MTSVKWLTTIEAIDHDFDGWQQAMTYRLSSGPITPLDPGVPLSLIQPRSLLVPPGIPDFLTRRRTVRCGRVELQGRAWSGAAPIVDVQVRACRERECARAKLVAGSAVPGLKEAGSQWKYKEGGRTRSVWS